MKISDTVGYELLEGGFVLITTLSTITDSTSSVILSIEQLREIVAQL